MEFGTIWVWQMIDLRIGGWVLQYIFTGWCHKKRDVNGQVDILSHFIYPIPWGISDIKTMIIGDVTLW